MRAAESAEADDVLVLDPGAWDVDDADLDADLDDDDDDGDLDDDGGGPADRAASRTRRRGRRTWAVVAGGAVAVVVALVGASELLRSPQERLEGRLTDALEDAGVRLAEPVSLEDGGAGEVWLGRLSVADTGGGVSDVRVALRPDEGTTTEPTTSAGLFPLVDCASPYPLSWPGDSDTSFRTTRSDLAECVTDDPGGGVLVTIAWRTGDDDDDDGDDLPSGAAGRQTWLTDTRGGVAWLNNGPGDDRGGVEGLTGEQQRAVVTAEGLLAAL